MRSVPQLYSMETYIAAYHWFGWKLEKAKSLYEDGARLDHLVRVYLDHTKCGLDT